MEYRKKLQKDHLLVFDDDLLDTLHEEFDADLEETEQKKIALELCLGKLKPRDLNLISARYDQRIPLADYAKSDGRTEGSLRVTLNRLRSLLKNCIDQQLLVNPSSSSL
jgi:RNA polymerase sigma-70 factor (ECF subfamily)